MGIPRTAFRAGCLFADCCHAGLAEMAETCAEVAARCLNGDANRVLVLAHACDPGGDGPLRDAFRSMLRAGIPAGLRLALVTDVSRVRAQFAALERDLLILHIHARSFGDESEALQWLRQAAAGPRVPAGPDATAAVESRPSQR